MHRVRMLFHFGVTPYIVFDGDRLPSKAGTEGERAARRKEARRVGEELLRLGKPAQAHDELKKAIDVTPEMARQFIEELKKFQVQYVVAPFEADSQMVYLENQGLVNGIVSEDSDLLVFGAKNLLTKLDQFGECIEIRQAEFTACRELNFEGLRVDHLRTIAILNGCDYLRGVPRMGLKTAHRLVRKFRSVPNPIEKIVQSAQLEGKIRMPPGYLESFCEAEKTFLYQWVFCPIAETLVNLRSLPKDVRLEDMQFLGAYVEPEIAKQVAQGLLDPMTKKLIPYTRALPPPSGKRCSPLKPKVAKGSKNSIDSFFKPTRTPLAELDPNSLTPSPSQQRALERNQGRSWTAQPATLHQSASEPRPLNRGAQSDEPRRLSTSAQPLPPPKRQRLCPEEEPPTPGRRVESRSRFFGVADPSPSLAQGAKKSRKPKHDEVHIWSDDSLEDAMAELPTEQLPLVQPVLRQPVLKSLPPSKKIPVFEDHPRTPQPAASVEEFSTKQGSAKGALGGASSVGKASTRRALDTFKLVEPKLSVPKINKGHIPSTEREDPTPQHQEETPEVTQEDNKETDNGDDPFHNNLMAEARALSAKFNSHNDYAITWKDSVRPRNSPVEPMTPPATSKAQPGARKAGAPSSVVKETPRNPDGDSLGNKLQSQRSISSSSPIKKPSPQRNLGRTDGASPPRFLKAKGSEDLLIVPDSDESDASAYSPNNTPRRLEGWSSEAEGSEMKATPNLRQFMFPMT